MTVNQRVSGSSPEGGALKIKGLQQCSPFFILSFRNISETNDKLTLFFGVAGGLKEIPIYSYFRNLPAPDYKKAYRLLFRILN